MSCTTIKENLCFRFLSLQNLYIVVDRTIRILFLGKSISQREILVNLIF